MRRLVAVSNRVTIPRRTTAAGGLAVGVLAAMKSRGGLWFGWSGEVVDGPPGAASVTQRQDVTFATIDLPAADFEPYYGGFCNGTLWPLFPIARRRCSQRDRPRRPHPGRANGHSRTQRN